MRISPTIPSTLKVATSVLPTVDYERETEKIVTFIRSTLKREGFRNVVIGVSGGVDSATSLFLLQRALPKQNIVAVYLPYFNTLITPPLKDIIVHPIKPHIASYEQRDLSLKKDRVRRGNVMARTRMIILYDLAKKHNALVCGTENKSEHLLGYFTRFGDAASDFEPIQHLYKTQVYQLARFLKVPSTIIDQPPSANLWRSQTDEGEFGFTYQEADEVLYLHFEKKMDVNSLLKQGYKNAKKILGFAKKNSFKHRVPYLRASLSLKKGNSTRPRPKKKPSLRTQGWG